MDVAALTQQGLELKEALRLRFLQARRHDRQCLRGELRHLLRQFPSGWRPIERDHLLPPLSDADFRSILDITQVADADKKRIASAEPLVGKKFDVYIIGEFTRQYDYVSASERTKLIADAFSRERFSFRDGLLCAESKCTSLIRWSDSELLEFDPKSGDLIAWWIEN